MPGRFQVSPVKSPETGSSASSSSSITRQRDNSPQDSVSPVEEKTRSRFKVSYPDGANQSVATPRKPSRFKVTNVTNVTKNTPRPIPIAVKPVRHPLPEDLSSIKQFTIETFYEAIDSNLESLTDYSADLAESLKNEKFQASGIDAKAFFASYSYLINKLEELSTKANQLKRVVSDESERILPSLVDLDTYQNVVESHVNEFFNIQEGPTLYKNNPLIDTDPNHLLKKHEAKEAKLSEFESMIHKFSLELTSLKIRLNTLGFFLSIPSKKELLSSQYTEISQHLNNIIDGNFKPSKEEFNRGGFGSIYNDRIGSAQLARKALIAPKKKKNEEWKKLIKEAHIALSIKSDYITKPVMIGENQEIYFPFSEYGDLSMQVENPMFDFNQLTRSLFGAAKGLSDMHQQGYIHRDIKPNNILFFDANGKKTKLTDFGTAQTFQDAKDKLNSCAGTPEYMSPEYLEEETTAKSDVWSFGIMIFEMLTKGNVPFPDELQGKNRTVPKIIRHIQNEFTKEGAIESMYDEFMKNKSLRKYKRKTDPHDFFKNLMLSCLHVDATKRPSMQEVSNQISTYAQEHKITL